MQDVLNSKYFIIDWKNIFWRDNICDYFISSSFMFVSIKFYSKKDKNKVVRWKVIVKIFRQIFSTRVFLIKHLSIGISIDVIAASKAATLIWLSNRIVFFHKFFFMTWNINAKKSSAKRLIGTLLSYILFHIFFISSILRSVADASNSIAFHANFRCLWCRDEIRRMIRYARSIDTRWSSVQRKKNKKDKTKL